ncbi:MAG: hypothetical protein ACLPIX_20820 [Rhodomicrobium sp.]
MTYIGGAAVVLEVTSAPTSSTTIYLLHDHLGSTGVITDSDLLHGLRPSSL